MIELFDGCTGADLVSAIEQFANLRRVPELELLGQLSNSPQKWKRDVAAAGRPTRHTIGRVRALLAGAPVPPPRQYGTDQERPASEASAATLNAWARDENSDLLHADATRRGSLSLLASIEAEARAAGERRAQAFSTGTVSHPLPPARTSIGATASPLVSATPASDDRRQPTFTREPCIRCGTRGDLGCRHQRPGEP